MRFPIKLFIVLLLSVCVLSPLPVCAAAKELKVGVVLSLTGDAASNGNAMLKGLELAAGELKALGWKVELNVQDGATNPGKVTSALQFLLSRGYRFFVGPTWSFEINAARPLLERSGALALVPAGSSDINGGASKALFNLSSSRAGMLTSTAKWLSERKHRKAFLLSPLGDWGRVHRELFLKALKSADVEVVGEEQFDYGIDPAALRVLMLRARQKGADLLLTTSGASDLLSMLKIRDEIHWEAEMLTTEDLWDVFDSGLLSQDSPMVKGTWALAVPLDAAFAAKYMEHSKEAPRMYVDKAYDALMLLAHALERTDGSVEAVRKYLAGQSDYTGVTGAIHFDQYGDRDQGESRVIPAFNNRSRN